MTAARFRDEDPDSLEFLLRRSVAIAQRNLEAKGDAFANLRKAHARVVASQERYHGLEVSPTRERELRRDLERFHELAAHLLGLDEVVR